jgi:hypothetical protein
VQVLMGMMLELLCWEREMCVLEGKYHIDCFMKQRARYIHQVHRSISLSLVTGTSGNTKVSSVSPARMN